ncbi:hypothetical protein BV22DRAFT_792990 [Leucogyrophana mollusca]|uniref:Uncharacterized protein n=1 Tax=Leucogyrophana mollusca TaxID=85980 RepID=A0ACB8B585_9AGAM|nr:hypothetical protein BV22DRAFT_792990 [Leucogyrophana mollusca]
MRILISNHEPCLSTKHAGSHNQIHIHIHVRSLENPRTRAYVMRYRDIWTFGTMPPYGPPAIASPTLLPRGSLAPQRRYLSVVRTRRPKSRPTAFPVPASASHLEPEPWVCVGSRGLECVVLSRVELRRAQLCTCLEGARPCVGFLRAEADCHARAHNDHRCAEESV